MLCNIPLWQGKSLLLLHSLLVGVCENHIGAELDREGWQGRAEEEAVITASLPCNAMMEVPIRMG